MSSPASLRLAVVAASLFSLAVLPDLAALRAPAAPSFVPVAAPDVERDVPALVRELTGQQLKALGVPRPDAWRLADEAVASARAKDPLAALAAVADDAAALAADPAGARGILAVAQSALRPQPMGRAITTQAIANAFGMGFADAPNAGLHVAAAGRPDASVSLDAAAAAAPLLGGTCQTCPNIDFGPFTPTVAWQTHSSQLCCSTNDCNWYAFDVEAGASYEFSLCSPDGSATFDTALDLFNDTCGFLASNDDFCGEQSRVTRTASVSGSWRLKVRGVGGATGSYTLAYRKVCLGAPTCGSPDGTLNAPTTACQYQAGAVSDCSGSRYYSVTLTQGQTYTFTLCGGTCASASAGFDSAVQLFDPSGAQVGNDSSACGDDGEVVYTTPGFGGGGTYCVVVQRESGAAADFTLGYRVACQAPSNVQITPDSASTSSPDCTKNQRFSATTAGTGPFDWTWTITPTAGQSASPSSGTATTTGGILGFDSLLTGPGTYRVTVTVTNECGTSGPVTIDFTLEDRAGPTLTPSAEPAACNFRAARAPAQPLSAPESGLDLSRLTRADMARVLAEPDPQVVQRALAQKLGVRPKSIVVMDRTAPGVVSPPGVMALGCSTPCDFGPIEADNPYYEVFLDCEDGSFTARTGPAHSVTISSGSAQNVIYGGEFGSAGTSDAAWYVHDNGTLYQDPPNGRACVMDPPDTTAEPDSAGIEAEWTDSPMAGVSLTLREEIVAFGDTEANSGVRLTLGATNASSSTRPVTMGVRWQIDYQNAGDDGPLFAGVHCQPFEIYDERSTEHEFTTAEIASLDFYRIQNNTNSPIFGNFTNATEIAGFPDTGKPDRLVYGYWPSTVNSPWSYPTTEGDTGPDSDSSVLYWFGADVGDGTTLAPGESFSRSVIIFTAGDAQDCGARRPGECATEAGTIICPGQCARVGATAVDGCGPATVELIATSPGAPPCSGNPCVMQFPAEGDFVYTWRATDAAGNQVECTSTVHVEASAACNAPPSCAAGGPAESECRTAAITDASVFDPDDDTVTWTWTSDNPSVTISPDSGTTPGTPGARPLPPIIVQLDPSVAPCDVTAVLTLSVSDGRGGTSSCTTNVTFDDDMPPALVGVPGEETVECSAVPSPAPVTAIDGCDASPGLSASETQEPGDCPGRYTIRRTWTATDHCGNTASATQTVHVVDTTPPEVEPSNAPIACLWPPNHWYVAVSVSDLSVTARDACSEPVTWRVSGCVSDQPDDAPERPVGDGWNGDGRTTQDCVVSPDGQTVHVRAERCGTGPTAQDGRHYGILVVAKDACGNESPEVVAGTVHVPHDQSPAARDCLDTTKVGCRELPCRD